MALHRLPANYLSGKIIFSQGLSSPYSDDTTELFPAKKNELDYYTIDKLCRINPLFKDFVTKATKVLNAQTEVLEEVKKGLQDFCEKGFSTQEEILAYCGKWHIPC